MSYAEKLKDPRWQKARMKILERDKFTCQLCEAKDKELQVHHRIYHRGVDPWNYDSNLLVTLCVECHEHVTLFKQGVGLYADEPHTHNCLCMIVKMRSALEDSEARKPFMQDLHCLISIISEHPHVVVDMVRLLHSYGDSIKGEKAE